MPFTTKDLAYRYQPGTTRGDDPKLRGEPDSSLFNRHEQHEMVYLLNKYCDTLHEPTIGDFQAAEALIHERPPGNLRSQAHVFAWLREKLG